MERRIGQFIIEGQPLASVHGKALSEDDQSCLWGLYTVGRQRTVEQDAAFGIRQIVDVALKALSPGVNDTTTAVMCIDQLTAILARLSDRRIELDYRSQDGKLRLITRGPTFGDLVSEALDQIRQNAAGNVAVLEGLLSSLQLLADRNKYSLRRRVLLEHTRAVAELSERSLSASRDRRRLADKVVRTLKSLGASMEAETGSHPISAPCRSM